MTLETALARHTQCVDAESLNRERALSDLKFANVPGEQWPETIRNGREAEQRPCLEVNRTQRFIKQVVNDIRQVRPAGKTRPVDSQSDPDTAEIMNGMIRAIEQSCNAEIAYDWATEYAVTMGWGYFRISCEYTDPESFEKDIVIKRVRNPFSVYLDPNRKEPDGSDAKFGFIVEQMSKEEFEAKYPDAQSEWSGTATGDRKSWFSKDSVQVAEYWELEEEVMKLSLMPDGSKVWGEIEGAVNVRDSKKTTLVQRIITGAEILEEKRYPWKYIPIIPVLGEEIDVEGEIMLKGMVRDMKDSARQYNYMQSAITENIALQSKAPWAGPSGAFKSPKWRSANVKNHAYLEWDTEAVLKAGGIPPKRQDPPQASSALIQALQSSAEELKAITGIYDPSLGDRSNEVSGTAINARKVQSDIANFHFVDNLARSIRHAWRIMLDMFPTIYPEERIVRILRPNGDEEAIKVNKPFIDDKQKPRFYNLTAGRYDVVVDIGPSYATQRQESVEGMLAFVNGDPETKALVGDLIAKNSDWAESDEFAKRLKTRLPPEVLADENPQFRMMQQQYEQQIQQGKQYIGALEAQIQQLAIQLQNKQGEIQVKQNEVDRKSEKDAVETMMDATELELKYQQSVPGAAV